MRVAADRIGLHAREALSLDAPGSALALGKKGLELTSSAPRATPVRSTGGERDSRSRRSARLGTDGP